MATPYQASLLDAPVTETRLQPLGSSVRRQPLTHDAWIDLRPGWIAGADVLFDRLVESVPWRAERRRMYERVVDVPRLVRFYHARDMLPDPLLDDAREQLSAHYATELGEPFRTAGLCYYRDGQNSVAWHGDTIGRSKHEDTMVAILGLGTPRALHLRPRGGGTSLRYPLGHGDLLVMGGSCQRTWEHCIPKTQTPAGPRISVQFRPHDVR